MSDGADPISLALREDIGSGDITSETFVPVGLTSLGKIIAKESAIVAGTSTASAVFQRVDSKLQVRVCRADGTKAERGDIILEVRGNTRSILTAERVALNFLQRLSGIATLTRQFVEAVSGTDAIILDTRKTTPGLRVLEKAAVVAGGGQNHRRGLFDMVLVKDNHLLAAGDSGYLGEAIAGIRRQRPGIKIEIEADRLEQVRFFLSLDGVDIILLDNMSPARIREAVAMGRGKVKFEASGGVTLDTVRELAETGVDYISVGALTHSARAVDLSLELSEER